MKDSLKDLLYSPTSIQTISSQELSVPQNQSTVSYDLSPKDEAVLQALEDLVQAGDAEQVDRALDGLKATLINGMTFAARPLIIQEYNRFLKRVSVQHKEYSGLYQKCLEVVVLFKNHLEKQEGNQGFMSQGEWVSLEQSLYFLNEWAESFEILENAKCLSA